MTEDLGELQKHSLGLNRRTQHRDDLVDLVLVHVLCIILESFDQFLNDLLQIFLVLLGEHAEQTEDFVYKVGVAEVEAVDELLEHVGLPIDQLLLEGLEQLSEPGDYDLLCFRLEQYIKSKEKNLQTWRS